MTPFEYPASEAQAFVARNANVRVEGAPIPNANSWFGGVIQTVGDFVSAQYPPYGVIVTPPGSTDKILVWFDATGRMRVIDVTGNPIVNEVPKAPYRTSDESFLYNVAKRLEEISQSVENALPTPGQAFAGVTTVLILLAVIAVFKK
jgi:hypothetical protein